MAHSPDPIDFSWITYGWVAALSVWGGVTNFIRKVKQGESRFNLMELVGEIVTSGFAGVMTFFLCEWSHTPDMLTAVLVGISGHMGARGITLLEGFLAERIKRYGSK